MFQQYFGSGFVLLVVKGFLHLSQREYLGHNILEQDLVINDHPRGTAIVVFGIDIDGLQNYFFEQSSTTVKITWLFRNITLSPYLQR